MTASQKNRFAFLQLQRNNDHLSCKKEYLKQYLAFQVFLTKSFSFKIFIKILPEISRPMARLNQLGPAEGLLAALDTIAGCSSYTTPKGMF